MAKSKKKKSKTQTEQKFPSKAKVDERVKQINAIEPPEFNPYKKENEMNIDRFLRSGFGRYKEKMPPKIAFKKKH